MSKKSDKIQVDIEEKDGVTRVTPGEDLDLNTSPLLQKVLIRLLKKKPLHVTVDLGRLSQVDTSGLATLVDFARRLEERGGDLTVCGLKESATDTLSLRQVKERLNFRRDCSEK